MNRIVETAKKAEKIFRQHGGMLRTSQAIKLGIHPRTLYQLNNDNRLIQLSRGVYRLASLPEVLQPDLVVVASKLPNAVICLISALAFHEITTEIPHEVSIALPHGARTPRLEPLPIRAFRFSAETLSAGVETHRLDGVDIKVFSPEKTVADCFKFRNQIGLDVALEALKLCLQRKRSQPKKLLEYARLCRVEKIMRPYLEALA